MPLYTPSTSGGITQSYIGYNAVGGSTETMTGNRGYAKKVTLTSAGVLSNIEAYIKGNGSQVSGLGCAVYADNAGVPGKLLAASISANTDVLNMSTTPGWVGLPVGQWLTAADYWIAVKDIDGQSIIAYDSGSDRIWAEGGAWWSDGSLVTTSDSTRKYSVRANFLR